jgi:pyruvate dehydrogenase E1 component beta subunit
MAKQLLISACMDPNPVVFLEPRWLYQLTGEVSSDFQEVPLDKARIIRKGEDLTIVSYGDGLLPAYQAAQELENDGISVEIIDLVSINPIDYTTIIESLNKTKKLLTIDTTSSAFSVGRELIGFLAQNTNDVNFQTMAAPNVPCPTATSLTASYYPTRVSIKNKVLSIFQLPGQEEELDFSELHLSPKTDCPYG